MGKPLNPLLICIRRWAWPWYKDALSTRLIEQELSDGDKSIIEAILQEDQPEINLEHLQLPSDHLASEYLEKLNRALQRVKAASRGQLSIVELLNLQGELGSTAQTAQEYSDNYSSDISRSTSWMSHSHWKTRLTM